MFALFSFGFFDNLSQRFSEREYLRFDTLHGFAYQYLIKDKKPMQDFSTMDHVTQMSIDNDNDILKYVVN